VEGKKNTGLVKTPTSPDLGWSFNRKTKSLPFYDAKSTVTANDMQKYSVLEQQT